VGWVHHSLRFGHKVALRQVVPEVPEGGSKTSMLAVVWANFGIFFGTIEMFSCRDWWPWTKSSYITMNCWQSNSQWGGVIAVFPTPKKSECKNPLKNSLFDLSFFFWVSIPLLVLSAIIDYTDHFFYSKRWWHFINMYLHKISHIFATFQSLAEFKQVVTISIETNIIQWSDLQLFTEI